MVHLLPTDAELTTFRTPDDLVTWAGLDPAVWNLIDNALGKLPHIRMIASLPQPGLKAAMQACRVPVTGGTARELNLAESIQIGLVWRASRKTVGMSDIDPLVDAPPPASTPSTTSTAAGSAKKVVKASAILDQLDDTEVPILSRTELDQAFSNHVAITGAEPNHEAEPTPEQIAAMSHRVLVLGEAPYADFSVLTPYGRRVQKQMKARAWAFQPDGTFKPLEVPGPPIVQCIGVVLARVQVNPVHAEAHGEQSACGDASMLRGVLRLCASSQRRFPRSLVLGGSSRGPLQKRDAGEVQENVDQSGDRRPFTYAAGFQSGSTVDWDLHLCRQETRSSGRSTL